MYDVQYNTHNVRHTMYDVQYNTHNVRHTMYNIIRTMYDIQCTMYIVHCSLHVNYGNTSSLWRSHAHIQTYRSNALLITSTC